MAVIGLYLLSVAVVISCMKSASNFCSEEGKVRFITGKKTDECPDCVTGAPQICEDMHWKRVCDRNFTTMDAAVACRSIGHLPEGNSAYHSCEKIMQCKEKAKNIRIA